MDTAREVTLRLRELLRREHGALTDFLVALAEFDARRLWTELGHASLFSYLHRDLGLSKGAAFYRAKAAELVQRFPGIVEPLRTGQLCLTTVVEVARVLTPENQHEVLPRFFGLSKREAQEVAAELRPIELPPQRDLVTAARVPRAAPALALATPRELDLGQEVHLANRRRTPPFAEDAATPPPAMPAAPDPLPVVPAAPRLVPDTVEPLSAEASRMHLTVPRRLVKKLEAARAALSHSHPGAGMADIIEAGLDLLLERHARRNGLVKRPRKEPRPMADPDRIPAHVRRAVWERDGGKCQAPVASGGVCGSSLRPELHHVVSRARGGPTTVDNLTTVCAFHHDLATRREFGDDAVDRHARRRPTPGGESGARPRATADRRDPRSTGCPGASP